MMDTTQKVINLQYHRNGDGVCGEPFHVGIVRETENGKTRDMLVVRFSKDADAQVGAVLCAAFDCALVGQTNINFGENSWRGDHYADVMDKAIKKSRAAIAKATGETK